MRRLSIAIMALTLVVSYGGSKAIAGIPESINDEAAIKHPKVIMAALKNLYTSNKNKRMIIQYRFPDFFI